MEPAESELTRLIISGLCLCRLFSVDSCATWTIEHAGARGAELLFLCDEALGYTTRIRRTSIGILLRIGECRERSHDRDHQDSSVQSAHSIRSEFLSKGQ